MPHPDDLLVIPRRFTLMDDQDGGLRLHSLTFSLALRDDAEGTLARMLPLLDGTRTVREIQDTLEGLGRAKVDATLDYLTDQGALERRSRHEGGLSQLDLERFAPQISFMSHFVPPDDAAASMQNAASAPSRSGVEFQTRLMAGHVVVFGCGQIGSQLVKNLTLAGVGTFTLVDEGPVTEEDVRADSCYPVESIGHRRTEVLGGVARRVRVGARVFTSEQTFAQDQLRELLKDTDCAIVCRDNVDPREYEAINEAALATGTMWTSGRLAGFEVHIGPTVIPRETACYLCFESRRRSNLPDLEEYEILDRHLRGGHLRPERPMFTPTASLLALEVVKALTWFTPPATCSHLLSMNLVTMQSRLHPILKVPRCTACGRPSQARPTINAWQQKGGTGDDMGTVVPR